MNETFEKALGTMIYLANEVASQVAYNQSPDVWTKPAFRHIKETRNADFWNEVFKLDDELRFLLGFKKWSSTDTEMLIPIWIIECLPDDFDITVTSISGARCSIKKIDKDTRFGCVAYMV